MGERIYGNMGKILHIDLTKKTYEVETATDELFKNWLGGRALNHYLLFRDVDVAHTDPLSPENEIIVSSGPLGGTTFPSCGRTQGTFLAPLPYSGWGDSNCGGHFGPEIKFCGYDAIAIKGKASSPTYVFVKDDKVEFLPADHLWGKGTIDTQAELKARHGERTRCLTIGQAGENLVRFACLRTDMTNSMGRCGGGAVFGSKNLKALALLGSTPVRLYRPKEFFEITKNILKDIMDPEFGPMHSEAFKLLSTYGLPIVALFTAPTGSMPIKNWLQCGIWEGNKELEKYPAEVWDINRRSCFACPIHSHSTYVVEDGSYPTRGGGTRYESVNSFGTKCCVSDGRKVLKLNTMANDYGVDVVSCGAIFSYLMELTDRGMVDKSYTDGVPLAWGDADAIIRLMPKIAFREGCGDRLAEGTYRVGKSLGEEALRRVYHQKGMEVTAMEMRAGVAGTLSYTLSPRGAHHLTGLPCAEWSNNPDIAEWMSGYREGGEFLSYHGDAKSKLVQYSEDLYEIVDSLGICKLTYGHTPLWHDRGEDMEKFYNYLIKSLLYATGIEYTENDLFRIGEKAYQIERATIVLRGITREDDMPNWRVLNESCPGEHPVNPVPVPPIDKKLYEKVLDNYYELRGWNRDGVPTRKRLEELGLKEVTDALEKGKG